MPALVNAAAILAPTATNLRTAAAVTAGTGATGVDTLDYDGQILVTALCTAYTSGTSNVVIESSDTQAGTYGTTAATGQITVGALTAAGVVVSAGIDLNMCRRWIRFNTLSTDTESLSAAACFHGVKKIR